MKSLESYFRTKFNLLGVIYVGLIAVAIIAKQ